jgi:hypothetical protein
MQENVSPEIFKSGAVCKGVVKRIDVSEFVRNSVEFKSFFEFAP